MTDIKSTPPPVLSIEELTNLPTVATPSLLGNTKSKALNSSTFYLPTSASISIGDSQVTRLHPATGATYAIVVVEAHPSSVAGSTVARFWQDGSTPSETSGLPLKDGGVIEVTGSANVENFRIISADDLAHVIQVQYYS